MLQREPPRRVRLGIELEADALLSISRRARKATAGLKLSGRRHIVETTSERDLPPATPAFDRSGRQLVEERLRLFQIARVKPSREPPVHRSPEIPL